MPNLLKRYIFTYLSEIEILNSWDQSYHKVHKIPNFQPNLGNMSKPPELLCYDVTQILVIIFQRLYQS